MFAGEYDDALVLLQPHADQDLAISHLIESSIAAILLMAGRPAESLKIALNHRMADSIWDNFGIIVGLSYLALGDRESAEQYLLAEARSAALGRMAGVSDGALVGLAALANDDGDVASASEIIFGTRDQIRTIVAYALSRHVAGQIGVRDDLSEAQRNIHEVEGSVDYDAIALLQEVLAAWDARG